MKDSTTNKPIVTAIASYGMSGEVFHAPLISANSDFLLKTILERNNNRSQEKYPQVFIAKDFTEILEDPEVELVIVNTPNTAHYPMAKAAIQAGKHVVVEKPFTISVKEGEELIHLAKQNGVLITVFHNKRLENDFLMAKKIKSENLIGEIAEVEWHYDRFRTHLTHKKWKEENNPGAGILYDLGAHLIDASLTLFGMPDAVTANLRILRKQGCVDDNFSLWLHYPNLMVTLKSSTLVKEQGPQLFLHGYNGSFLKYGSDPQEQMLKSGITPEDESYGEDKIENWGIIHTEANGKSTRKTLKTIAGCYPIYYKNLFESIRNQKELMVKPEEALNVIRIIETAIDSARHGRTIRVMSNE